MYSNFLSRYLISNLHFKCRFVHVQVKNYFVAAGMNSTGVASAGGFGRALAEWIADGKTPPPPSLPLSLSLSPSSFSFPLVAYVPCKHKCLGEPPCDLWEFDITRFGPHTANRSYLCDRAVEVLGRHFSLPWPHWELESGRGVKQTPFHSRLEAAGASFGCVYGWERPNWFAEEGGS